MSRIGVVATGTLAGLIAFAALSLVHFGEQFGPFYLSAVSVLLGIFVLTMGWLVSAYSARNLRGQARQGRYAALLATAIAALWVAVVADPIALMAAGWTVSGLAIAGLVSHSGTPAARSAGRRVAGRLLVGDAALWTAVVLMAAEGIVVRSEVAAAGWLVPALLALAGIVRSALVPAWRWLPLTAEAPSPVSALLHAGVVNGMGLLAILLWPVFAAAPAVLLGLVVVGGLTAVAGTAAMRVRPDVKGKLASSTSAQMGYMTLQVGLGLPAFAMLHLIGHGFYKAWLFLRAGGASRRAAAPSLSTVKPAALVGLAAASAAVISLATTTWLGRPVVDLVPLAVAGAASTFALAALVWPDRRTATHSTPRARAWSMLATLAGLFGYVVVLGAWSRVFPEPGVWVGSAAVALVTAVLVAGTVGMIAVARGWLASIVQPVVIDTAARVKGRVPQVSTGGQDVTVAAEAAMRTVGAMWPLHSAVAVNPLSGLQDMSFADAAEIAGRTWGAQSRMAESQYAVAMATGRFTHADLVAASKGYSLPAEQVAGYLQARVQWRASDSTLSAAERVLSDLDDAQIAARLPRPAASPHTLGEQAGIADKVSALANGWTAIANGDQPGPGHLWTSFQEDVRDLGLRGLRETVQGLPVDPVIALGRLLDGAVPAAEQVGYLSRLLARDPGWAAHLKQRHPGLLADLLAIRASFDVLASGARGQLVWEPATRCSDRDWAVAQVAPVVELLAVTDAQEALALAGALDEASREAIWQRAWEQRYRNRLIDRVATRAGESVAPEVPAAQVVMCIDVRSERFRRHLEAAGDIATFGFAGFFGVAIRHETAGGAASDQCPVLLKPSFLITENDAAGPGTEGITTAMRGGLVTSTARPASAFAVAEGFGVLAGADALAQTAAPGLWGRWRDRFQPAGRGELHIGRMDMAGAPDHGIQWGMSVAQRTTAAAGMLRALGLVEQFAPVILVTGHAATVENNAFAAAYDCGACGGNGGHVNARVMAAVLNDPRVRRRLADEHGIVVPGATIAVPAWHNTTTDEVRIDPMDVPSTHAREVAELRTALAAAQIGCLQERMAELPGVRETTPAAAARRAADWAEPQPEWGLAGNAAFVIGPRRMTKGLNLRGRVFLHSYEPGLDVDGSTLELLLTAPMVVTQWINNQYYFATVDPGRFGAGDKTTHNVVGDYGVFSGAGGDLRVGLPWQGVFREQPGDGAQWMHEPLRLQVVVYAEPDDIVRVLDAHPQVAALVANEWIALAAIAPSTGEAYALGTDLQWRAWLGESVADAAEDIIGVLSREG
jgi:uncharacterized protein